MGNTSRKRRSEAGRSGGIFVLSEDVTGTPVYAYHPDYYSVSVASSCSFDTVNNTPVPMFVDENNTTTNPKARSWNGTSDPQNEKPHKAVSHSLDLNHASNCKAGHSILENINGNKQPRNHGDRIATPGWFNSASKITHKAANVFQHTKTRWSTIRPREVHSEHTKAVGDISCLNTTTEKANDSIVTSAEPELHSTDGIYMRHESNTPDFGYGYFSTVDEYLQAEAAIRSFWPVTDLNEVDGLGSSGNVEAEPLQEVTSIPTSAAVYETPKRDMRTHYEVLGLSQHCHGKE